MATAWEQRYAELEVMVADACASMKRMAQRIDQRIDDQSTLDRKFRDYLMLRNDDDDETWTWTEHYSVMDDERNLLEEESMPQFQVPVSDSEIVRSIEPGKVDLGLENEEYVVMNESLGQDWVQKSVKVRFEADGDVGKGQKVISNTKICCAHKVFGKMAQHQERLGIKKKKKGFKSWMFKYKKGNKKRDLLLLNGKDNLALRAIRTGLETVERDSSNQERSKLCTEDKGKLKGCWERLQASVLMKEESESMIVKEVKVETQTIDKGISTLLRGQSKRSTIMESLATMDFVVKPKEISFSHCIAQFHTMLLRLQSKRKQRKCPKCWMFKFRKKKIDQQLGCDLMVPYLENQTTWTSRFDEEDQRNLQSRTENSLSRREISAFIYQAEALLFESKESAIFANQEPEISATPEPATFQSDNAHGMITRGKDGIVKPNLRYSLLAVQRIWEKETHDVDIPDAYYVLQEEFEQVENHTPCSVVKLERPQDHDALLLPFLGDERFQIKHKWRFKLLLSILELELYLDSLVLITSYAHQFDIISLIILMSAELSVFFSTKPNGFFFSTKP